MPVRRGWGPLITFAIYDGGDQKFSGYTYTRARGRIQHYKDKKHHRQTRWVNAESSLAIAARQGDPSLAYRVATLNSMRGIQRHFRPGRRVRIPDRLRNSAQFNVLAGDTPPTITDGYARITVLDRPQRTGLSVFTGYNPMVLRVPIRFEAIDEHGGWLDASGVEIEKDIKLLEQMAGRGQFQGEGVGAPPILNVTTTNADGVYTSLIPDSLQVQRAGAPISTQWWVSSIEWDDEALRNRAGNRIRQLAVVELTEYVKPAAVTASAAARHKTKHKKKKKHT
jgi:hypothetical protein